ncbi:MAG TPA: polymorphic toxin type 24 domain-containing protein [Pseudonocardiaceae bacterium]
MTVTLPRELAGLLGEIGGRWPEADEDRLAELAGAWRFLGERVQDVRADGVALAGTIVAEHDSGAIDAFADRWRDFASDLELVAEAAGQVATGVDAMAVATVQAKQAVLGVLESTNGAIQHATSTVGAAFLGPVIGWIIRAALPFLVRILAGLFRLVWRFIVWLFGKIAQFFRWLWNKLFGKRSVTPTRPTYARNGPLPHARDLLRNGTQYQGRRLPSQSQPNSVLYKRDPQSGQITNYTVYDDVGNAIKRVDLTGRSHGGVPTPHVVEYTVHRNPATGQVFVREGRMVRPANPQEIP